jgi:hypothetical protein
MANTQGFRFTHAEFDGVYHDLDFDNGDLCKRHIVTFDTESKKWSGLIQTSETPEDAFDGDDPMPADLLESLIALIPDKHWPAGAERKAA